MTEPSLIDKPIPTHRCLCCEATWAKHADGTWSLMSKHCGQCCNNAPMGGQMIPLELIDAWKPAIAQFRQAASRRGMSEMSAWAAVRAIVAEAPDEAASTLEDQARLIGELQAAVVALADGAERCGEAPHFIVQPFLAIYKKHGETIAKAREQYALLTKLKASVDGATK